MMPHSHLREISLQLPWRRIQELKARIRQKRGYARLGYGNYGNLDARANYLFILPNSDKLNLNFHMNGMDGKLDLLIPRINGMHVITVHMRAWIMYMLSGKWT